MKSLKDKIQENNIKHYVDGILVNTDNQILILRRANYMKQFPGAWGFVGGSIDKKDNSSKDAIIREIKEETGIELTDNEIKNMFLIETHQHLGGNNDEKIVSDTEYWLVKLDSNPEIKISREHSKYEWINEEEIKERKRNFISDVFHYIEKYYKNQI